MTDSDKVFGGQEPEQLDKGQKPGDILLFYDARGTALLITWFTNSQYYHVGIADEDLFVVEARPSGVVRRDLRGNIGGHKFVVIPSEEKHGRTALEWASAQVGETYDAIGAIVCALEYKFSWLNLNYRSPGTRYSCAELVATAFDKAGKILIPDHRHDELVPADFARLLPKSAVKPE